VWDHTVVMQLSLGTGNRTLRDGFTSFNDSAIDALQTWNPYLAHLRFSWVRNSPVTPTKGDDEISVIFYSKVFGSNFGTGALAVTTLASRNGTLEETDTVFNNAISWDSYRGPLTPPVFDFRRVAIHEFGHTLGLDHPDQAKPKQIVVAIMNSRVSDLDTLAQDDINGVRSIYGTGPPYHSVAYDFNQDGHPDFVLDNAVPHQTAVWYLNNNVFSSGLFGPTVPAGWSVVGVADFNGDGHPDYLLFNSSTRQTAVWYLNNNVFSSGLFGPTVPAGWSVAGVADFNGDGHPDYLLFNSSTQQTAIWYLNNNVFSSGLFGPTLPAGWSVVGVADFNGDGHPDYLLFNSSTRQTAIWYLNNNVFSSGLFGPTLPIDWAVVGAADFNGDSKPDYALFDAVTHQTAVWYLNNNIFSSGLYGPSLPANWSLIAP